MGKPAANTKPIVCKPATKCADPHPHRWHCERGHGIPEDGIEAQPGICPLRYCDQRGANR